MIDLASLKWEEQLALRKWVWVGGWVGGVRRPHPPPPACRQHSLLAKDPGHISDSCVTQVVCLCGPEGALLKAN